MQKIKKLSRKLTLPFNRISALFVVGILCATASSLAHFSAANAFQFSTTSYKDGAGGDQVIKVMQAPGDKPKPAIIFVHGGGWFADGGQWNQGFQATVAERGYTSFRIKYRLMSNGIDEQLNDVMAAIAHIRKNAAQYNVDPNRIALMGDSAGGSLVVRAGATGKSDVKAVVGWSAPANAFTNMGTNLTNAFTKRDPAYIASTLDGLFHSNCIDTRFAETIMVDVIGLKDEFPNAYEMIKSAQAGRPPTVEAVMQEAFNVLSNPKTKDIIESIPGDINELLRQVNGLAPGSGSIANKKPVVPTTDTISDKAKAEEKAAYEKSKKAAILEENVLAAADRYEKSLKTLELFKDFDPETADKNSGSYKEYIGTKELVDEAYKAYISAKQKQVNFAEEDSGNYINRTAESISKERAELAKQMTVLQKQLRDFENFDIEKADKKSQAYKEFKNLTNALNNARAQDSRLKLMVSELQTQPVYKSKVDIQENAKNYQKDQKKLEKKVSKLSEEDIAEFALLAIEIRKATENGTMTPQEAQVLDIVQQGAGSVLNAYRKDQPEGSASWMKTQPVNPHANVVQRISTCMKDFLKLSPALNASPRSPAMFLVTAQSETLVTSLETFQMRDKLRSMGIRSEALILPGDRHMGWDPRAVEPSLKFLDSVLNPTTEAANALNTAPGTLSDVKEGDNAYVSCITRSNTREEVMLCAHTYNRDISYDDAQPLSKKQKDTLRCQYGYECK